VLVIAALALLGGIFVAALRLTDGDERSSRPRATETTRAATAVIPMQSAAATAGSAASDDLPPSASVPPGYGILEIVAPAGARVRVDGADAEAGPLSSSVLRAGYHQVRVEQGGHDSQYVIEVRAGKTTHVKSAPLP
jgi:hypothetical protein